MTIKITKDRLAELKKTAAEMKIRAASLADALDGAEEVEKADAADESEVVAQAKALLEILSPLAKMAQQPGESKCPKCGYVGEPDKEGKCPKCGMVMKAEAAVEKIDALEKALAGRDAAIEKLIATCETAVAEVEKAKKPKCGEEEDEEEKKKKAVAKFEERIKALEETAQKAEAKIAEMKASHEKEIAEVKKSFSGAPGSQLPADRVDKGSADVSFPYDLAEEVRQQRQGRGA